MLRRTIIASLIATSLAVQSVAVAADVPQPPVSTWAVPSASSPAPPAPPAQTPANNGLPSVARGNGVAVLALDGATDAAWRLAARVYRGPLRPPALDELHARALVGEPIAPGAAKDLQDLAETRAAIHGDDAPSRRLLGSLAAQLGVEAIIVVQKDGASPATARAYLASNEMFDAARYAEDGGSWESTAASLERALKADPRPASGDAPATQPASGGASGAVPIAPAGGSGGGEAPRAEGSKPFYKSVWFWGALGAAVFAGGAIFLATRDNGDGTGAMHLQVKVPR